MQTIFFPPAVVMKVPSSSLPQISSQNFTHDIDVFNSIRCSRYDEVKLALESGKIHINAKNSKGQTLLIAAICYNQVAIAKYLIFLGADLEMPDLSGKSAKGYINEREMSELYNTEEVIASFQHGLYEAQNQSQEDVEAVGESGSWCG